MLKLITMHALLLILLCSPDTNAQFMELKASKIQEQKLKTVEEAHKEHLSTQSDLDPQKDLDQTCKMLVSHEWFNKFKSLIIIGPNDRFQKQYLAKRLALEHKRAWAIITSELLLGATHEQTIENVKTLFNYIINHDKSPILIIDNIDALIDYSKEHTEHNNFENQFKQLVKNYEKEKKLILIAISNQIAHIADVKSFAGDTLFTS